MEAQVIFDEGRDKEVVVIVTLKQNRGTINLVKCAAWQMGKAQVRVQKNEAQDGIMDDDNFVRTMKKTVLVAHASVYWIASGD